MTIPAKCTLCIELPTLTVHDYDLCEVHGERLRAIATAAGIEPVVHRITRQRTTARRERACTLCGKGFPVKAGPGRRRDHCDACRRTRKHRRMA